MSAPQRMVHALEGVSPDPRAFWITTSSGLHFYPRDPEGSTYRIKDIAHALSQLCRFAGHCKEFYSVAEHSVMVSRIIEGMAGVEEGSPGSCLWGLLHDASEAYLVDIPRPVKQLPELSGYRALEKRTMDAIVTSFGLTKDEPNWVKNADLLALRSEAFALGLLNRDWDVYDWPDCGIRPAPLAPKDAEAAFLARYREVA